MEQNTSEEYDVIIIDPTSPDISRGSFCYLPYIYYNACKEKGLKVKLYEDFTIFGLDKLPKAKTYLIAFWSYPQTELCHVLNEFIPSDNIYFFGYYPFIDAEKLPKFIIPDDDILVGIRTYPKYFKDFKYLLLCDDDMHLKKYEGTIYPLFTSYGCPQSCAFCSTAVNCKNTRITLSLDETFLMLREAHNYGVRCVHFTDEDFFWTIDRTYEILQEMIKYDFKCIALGSVQKVQKFVDKYGEQILIDAGMKIIEVGFETGSEELSKKMHKRGVTSCEKLANTIETVDIFWLTMSLFPGETIDSLNKTGKFLAKYGQPRNEVYGRLQTNGTEGGLGQFFLPYTGTAGIKDLEKEGIIMSPRPLRLFPSFIPNSFLDSHIEEVWDSFDEDRAWFDLYNINPDDYSVEIGQTVRQNCERYENLIKAVTFFGVCARLRIIQS